MVAKISTLVGILQLLVGLLNVTNSLAGEDKLGSRGTDHIHIQDNDDERHPSLTITAKGQDIHGKPLKRDCTVEDLLPRSSKKSKRMPEWSHEHVDDFPYNCTCSSLKGRYYCPHLGDHGYPKWVPQAVTDDRCKTVSRQEMKGRPLPTDFKVLLIGNSHLRQALQAVLCMFESDLSTKRVIFGITGGAGESEIVDGGAQCRGCSEQWKPDYLSDIRKLLLNGGCMDEEDTCRCSDDHGEFVFNNGAEVHYVFWDAQKDKHLYQALEFHGDVPFSYYDAVIANSGNANPMTTRAVLEAAYQLKLADVPFFWLSTFLNVGDISKWSKKDREKFHASGAHFVPIGDMMIGLNRFRKGRIEPQIERKDTHYCLPGPPDEIGILLVKLLWGVFRSRSS